MITIRLYEVIPNGVGVCAIMQYISEDILKYIKRNRGIKENEARKFFQQVENFFDCLTSEKISIVKLTSTLGR